MDKIITELDSLLVQKLGFSKVFIDYEDKNKSVKVNYVKNKGYGNKAFIIYFQNGEISDLKTNYFLKEDFNYIIDKNNVVEVVKKILEQNETTSLDKEKGDKNDSRANV